MSIAPHECVHGDTINLYCKSQFELLKSDTQEIKNDIRSIKNKMTGNGKDGYDIRIDRLEQSKNSRSRVEWLILSAFIVILVNALWGLHIKLLQKTYGQEKNDVSAQKTVVESERQKP